MTNKKDWYKNYDASTTPIYNDDLETLKHLRDKKENLIDTLRRILASVMGKEWFTHFQNNFGTNTFQMGLNYVIRQAIMKRLFFQTSL